MKILDTDIMIDVLRQYPPAVAWLETLGEEELALPGYVVMELIQGCRDKQELQRLQAVVGDFELLWPAPATCDTALDIFSRYRLSHAIGLLDALIGQTAASLSLPLHTFNSKHYAVIPNSLVTPLLRL